MVGLLFSLSNFARKMSSTPGTGSFKSFKVHMTFFRLTKIQTSKYQLHYWESPTGIKLVLNTSTDVEPCHDHLSTLYHHIFIQTVVKNPLVPLTEPINSSLFVSKLDAFIKQQTFFQDQCFSVEITMCNFSNLSRLFSSSWRDSRSIPCLFVQIFISNYYSSACHRWMFSPHDYLKTYGREKWDSLLQTMSFPPGGPASQGLGSQNPPPTQPAQVSYQNVRKNVWV